MVETKLRWFEHVERRLDHMEDSRITRGRVRPRKTTKKDLEINDLDRNMVYDRTLWCNLIHVVNPT